MTYADLHRLKDVCADSGLFYAWGVRTGIGSRSSEIQVHTAAIVNAISASNLLGVGVFGVERHLITLN